jgi:hypothetical protein
MVIPPEENLTAGNSFLTNDFNELAKSPKPLFSLNFAILLSSRIQPLAPVDPVELSKFKRSWNDIRTYLGMFCRVINLVERAL